MALPRHVTTRFLFMFPEFTQQFLTTLGGTTVAIAAVAWLARSITTNLLSKDIETYKAQLKSRSDVSLEQLRSELQIMAAQRNLEFSRIHEKRLEIVSEIAGKLDAFHQAIKCYIAPFETSDDPSKEQRRKLVADTFTKFNDYYRPRRFFLPEHTIDRVEAFRTGLYEISMEFMLYVEQGRSFGANLNHDLVWVKASDYTKEEAPKLFKELEGDFRKILGVDNQVAQERALQRIGHDEQPRPALGA